MNAPSLLHFAAPTLASRLVQFFALLLTLAAGCHAHRTSTTGPAPIVEHRLTPAERKTCVASFDYVWEVVRTQRFDPSFDLAKWDAAKAVLRPRVEQAGTMADARQSMSALLALLGKSHYAIIPADVYEVTAPKKKAAPTTGDKPNAASIGRVGPPAVPSATSAASTADEDVRPGVSGIDIRVGLDNQALVVRVAPNSAAGVAGVKPGWILTAVDNEPIAPLVAELNDSVSATLPREELLSRSVERMLHGTIDEKIEATFLDGSNATAKRTLTLTAEPGDIAKFGNLPTMYLSRETKLLDAPGGKRVGYFSLNIFLDPPGTMAAFEAALRKSGDADGFVIDLRGNPGGIGVMAMGMGGWFVDKPGTELGSMSMTNTKLKFVLNPRRPAFKKPLAILIDGCSASTSEIFAGGMRDTGRAKIFGTRSAGAALPSQVDLLPDGDRFQYAVADYVSAGGERLEGNGVTPDVVVEPNRAALLSGNDPVIDAAVMWIGAGGRMPATTPTSGAGQ